MNNFDFETLRRSFLCKDIALLKSNTTKLIETLLEASDFNIQAYFHPLGFVYAKLYEFENMETIRIHIWNRKYYENKAQMEIHNHYYIVNSFLYRGCINNNIYRPDEENGETYAIYNGAYNSKGDRILQRSSKQISLSLSNTDLHCENELYQIPIDTIHSGHPDGEGMVCTVVYTEKPGVPTPLVVGPLNGELEYNFPNKAVDHSIFKKVLAELMSFNKVPEKDNKD